MSNREIFDVLGVGIGPSNLSLAALLNPVKDVSSCFQERRVRFEWHPGLMFPEANIQVSFLKDLVTLADPTSSFSFVSFLHAKKRLYRFITANFPRISRLEYNQYLQWVCASLPNLKFGCEVEAITHDGNSFVVYGTDGPRHARNLVLGTGLSPAVPSCAKKHLGHPTVFSALEFLNRQIDATGLRVAVVGGGQTGAEIVSRLLLEFAKLPSKILWVSRRHNFLPLDESPFANELFTPAYSKYFFKLMPEEKAKLLLDQKLASDGVASDLLETIYRRLYNLEFLHNKGRICSLRPGSRIEEIERCDDEWMLTISNPVGDRMESLPADIIILCTGFEYRMPPFLTGLSNRIRWTEAGYNVGSDFSIEWDGPADHKIFVQNAAQKQRGIADPNLSLIAWRSATIINSVVNRSVYDVDQQSTLFDWEDVPKIRQAVGGTV
jgi:lysine N6-hydroxylase